MLNRIKELRKNSGMKQVGLAKSLGTTQANLSGWENNKWQPDSENIAKMCKLFNCSADYLIGISEIKHNRCTNVTRLGEKIKNLREKRGLTQRNLALKLDTSNATISRIEKNQVTPDTITLNKIASFFGVTVDFLLGESTTPQKKSIKKVSIYGTIPAGIPTEMIDESYIDDWEEIDTNSFNPNFDYLGLKVKGDSMYPEFREGDTLILRVQNDCTSGDYCAVSINNTECTFKKVLKQTNGITLQPLNPVYEPVFYSNKEVVEIPIVILGVLVEVRRSYK